MSPIRNRFFRAFAVLTLLALALVVVPRQLAAQTPVLDLDGKDAYVALPSNLFTNDVVTAEGWVKWRAFGDYSRFFEFTDASLRIGVINFGLSPELAFQRVLTPRY